MSLQRCQLISFPKVSDPRGNLTFIEQNNHIPFDIKRVYYLYDVPAGARRAAHAHKECHVVLIALSGGFEVVLNDGVNEQLFYLSEPYTGLYIPAMIWRDLRRFSSNAVCLSLASDYFKESDYYRNYQDFLNALGSPHE